MNYDQRIALVRNWLTQDMLKGFKPPEGMDESDLRAEIAALADQINHDIPNGLNEQRVKSLLGDTKFYAQRRHGGRQWPPIKIMVTALGDALKKPSQANTGGLTVDEYVREFVLGKRNYCYQGHKTDARAQAMIDEGICSWNDLHKKGFFVPKELRDTTQRHAGDILDRTTQGMKV